MIPSCLSSRWRLEKENSLNSKAKRIRSMIVGFLVTACDMQIIISVGGSLF